MDRTLTLKGETELLIRALKADDAFSKLNEIDQGLRNILKYSEDIPDDLYQKLELLRETLREDNLLEYY